jgi:Fe-S-cluster formation regulator IscX/YfhJ
VPVVVAGQTLLNPYEGFGVETVEGEHVVGAVERIAMAPSPPHSAIATDAFRASIGNHADETIAIVTRSRDGLRAELEALPTVDPAAVRKAVPKVIAALRQFDDDARCIDVAVAESPR